MYLNKVTVKNFRNIELANLEFNKNVNLILGQNAQGKTNLLEAIWLLSGNKSFRGAGDREFIGFDKTGYFIGGEFLSGDEETSLKIGCEKKNEEIRKKIVKNDKEYKTQKALLGSALMTVFSPDDLEIIKQGPALRRNFCDILIATLFPSYAKTLSYYLRIVSQKNALLKEGHIENLDIWNNQLALYAASIVKSRTELLKRLTPYVKNFFNEMTSNKEEIEIEYETSVCLNFEMTEGEIAVEFLKKLNENEYKEIAAGTCLYGAQRDDILITVNGKDARNFASQGQQRSAVLALILAKTQLIKEQTGKTPIVLLDDVMSELDDGRRQYLLEKIENFQVIITGCREEIFKNHQNIKTFYVENGKFVGCED